MGASYSSGALRRCHQTGPGLSLHRRPHHDHAGGEAVHYTITYYPGDMYMQIQHSTRLAALVMTGVATLPAVGCAKNPDRSPRVASSASIAAQPSPGSPAAPDTPGGESDQSEWLSFDAATNTVTFELIAGPFTFNGYRNGEGTLVVPSKANIVMNFVNKDGTPHSALVISGEGAIPNSASDPAIPRAYTNKVLEGLPQEAGDVMRFPVPESGTYRIFCGVPGHGLSGMWIWMKVDPAAKAPSFGRTKA